MAARDSDTKAGERDVEFKLGLTMSGVRMLGGSSAVAPALFSGAGSHGCASVEGFGFRTSLPEGRVIARLRASEEHGKSLTRMPSSTLIPFLGGLTLNPKP